MDKVVRLPIRYRIPAETTRVEEIIKGSHFLASLAYAPTREEAEQWIRQWRKEFADATHNCPAFRVGYGLSAEEWASDDGEPSGTAGKPMLSVLQGAEIGDIVVVVTRYSSGIKLGTGGLVRAYSGLVRQGLEALPTKMRVEKNTHLLATDYQRFERVKALLGEYEADILEEDFGTDIVFTLEVPVDRKEDLDKALIELTHGQSSLMDD